MEDSAIIKTPRSTRSPDGPERESGGAARAIARRGLIEVGAGAAAALASARRSGRKAATCRPLFRNGSLRPERRSSVRPMAAPHVRSQRRRRYRHGLPEPPTRLSSFSLTPLQDLSGIVTPNGLHYERHHSGTPTIDPLEHRLIVHGMVEKPLIFTMEEVQRFPSVSRVCFLDASAIPRTRGRRNRS